MKLASYVAGGKDCYGVVVGDGVVTMSGYDSLRHALEAGAIDEMRKAAADAKPDFELADIRFLPAIPNPRKILCAGINYRSHAAEVGRELPKQPSLFIRFADTLVGHDGEMVRPLLSDNFDFEGELAIVIGRGGRHIPAGRALDHVAGYSCYNEGSVREFQGHNRQFGLGKSFERSGAFGPWLMTPDEFGDPYAQRVISRLNGIVRQDSSLDDMLFKVDRLIQYLSTGYALRPGDVIVTGTPGTLPLKPGETQPEQFGGIKVPGVIHMRPGDVVEVEVTGLGVLENKVAADAPAEYRPA